MKKENKIGKNQYWGLDIKLDAKDLGIYREYRIRGPTLA